MKTSLLVGTVVLGALMTTPAFAQPAGHGGHAAAARSFGGGHAAGPAHVWAGGHAGNGGHGWSGGHGPHGWGRGPWVGYVGGVYPYYPYYYDYAPPLAYAAPPAWFYYCYNPAGYYPAVPYCPGGWTPVPSGY